MTICDLYHFDFDEGPEFFYTSVEVDIDYDGDTYLAAKGLSRQRPPARVVGEAPKSEIEITLDGVAADLVRQWDAAGPMSEVRVTIYSAERADIAGTIEQTFPGIVQTISADGKTTKIRAGLRSTGAERNGPRGHFSTRCRHALYGPGCKADIETFKRTGDTTFPDPDEKTIRVFIGEELTGGHFLGGVLLFNGSGRRIMSQDEPVSIGGGLWAYDIGLHYWIDGLESAPSVDIAPGCDRMLLTCDEKFSNSDNFGGFSGLAAVRDSPFRGGWRERDRRGGS